MAMELLQALDGRSLPLTVKDEAVVEQLRWLRAANFITAVISNAGAARPFATVLSITRRGREALRLEQAAASGRGPAEADARARPKSRPRTAWQPRSGAPAASGAPSPGS